MLLRFRAQNDSSLREAQELSLVASPLGDTKEGLIPCPMSPSGWSLPAVVIYGANASGKSNLLAALHRMRAAVLFSHSRGEPGGGVNRTPFALDDDCRNAPTIYDMDFVVDDVRYHYGFEASSEAYLSEWLYAYPNGRRQMLFEREGRLMSFGRSLKGRNKVISELMRQNSLFLSTATQNGHEDLSKITHFFKSLHNVGNIAVNGAEASIYFVDENVNGRVIKFLETIGTGVIHHRKSENDLSELELNLRDSIVSAIKKTPNISSRTDEIINIDRIYDKIIQVELGHISSDGSVIYFNLDSESAGTRRLLILLSSIFKALDTGSVITIDEINASLHTQACEQILELFLRPETNPKGAQLIATTHDTNLLRSEYLRRDQIWFTEKDQIGATHLYPLTDIQTRKGDNIEKGYLQGRFGAIPFSGGMSRSRHGD